MTNRLYDTLLGRGQPDEKLFLTTPTGQHYTYGELRAGTGRVAATLSALGVQPGDRVAVQVEKCPEQLLVYLGCVQLGAVLLPLNTAYTGNEVAQFAKDAEPTLLLCRPQLEATMTASPATNPPCELAQTVINGTSSHRNRIRVES